MVFKRRSQNNGISVGKLTLLVSSRLVSRSNYRPPALWLQFGRWRIQVFRWQQRYRGTYTDIESGRLQRGSFGVYQQWPPVSLAYLQTHKEGCGVGAYRWQVSYAVMSLSLIVWGILTHIEYQLAENINGDNSSYAAAFKDRDIKDSEQQKKKP